MHRLTVCFLFIVFLPVSAATVNAAPILEEARLALSGGSDQVPVRIEVDAVYRYSDREEPIRDHTVMEPGRRLFQERQIDGQTIRRVWTPEEAFLESPSGREVLDETMRKDLEIYFCLRQLELLVLCPGAEARQTASSPERHLIEIHRDGSPFAVLEIDATSRRLSALRYQRELVDDLESGGLTEVRYSDFETEDGWTLPHLVETLSDGAPTSTYSVQRWQVETAQSDQTK